MGMAQALAAEFEHEMTTTRTALERVPEDNLGWKPHDKSMSMIGLATHLANVPTWALSAINESEFDIAPSGGELPRVEAAKSVGEMLERFDKNVTDARAVIAGASDEQLFTPWTLKSRGKEVFTLPRVAVLRSMVFSHMIHHRGQLSVYLRLNDVPVPPIYGPTADEPGM